MLWQLRGDFVSLFNRGNDNLDPIDGLRSIANLSIIFLHLVSIFSAFVLPYPNVEWSKYLNSLAFATNNIISCSIEIFFMLSSFLLTYKLLIQWNKRSLNIDLFVLKEYPLLLIRRALRFWPGILFVSLILFVFGEPRYPDSGYLFEFFRHLPSWIFIQNYIDFDYWYITFAPLWSISLDMQVYIILPLLLCLFHYQKSYLSIYNCLSILLILSIIRGIIVYNPVTMPISSVAYYYPSLPLLTPTHLIDWLGTNYNLTFHFDLPKINPTKVFMNEMYLPLQARFGSFIIGSMLAIKIVESSNNTKTTKATKLKKYLFFGLISFYLLSTLQSANIPPSPPAFILKLAIASSRQLFTICFSFILFTALCPSTHPYHSSWIKTFLSASIWIPISKLSYFVYLIHLRISFELIFGGPLKVLRTFSVTNASLISLPIVLFLTQIISCFWFLLIEKPIQRFIQIYFNKNHQLTKFHL